MGRKQTNRGRGSSRGSSRGHRGRSAVRYEDGARPASAIDEVAEDEQHGQGSDAEGSGAHREYTRALRFSII